MKVPSPTRYRHLRVVLCGFGILRWSACDLEKTLGIYSRERKVRRIKAEKNGRCSGVWSEILETGMGRRVRRGRR